MSQLRKQLIATAKAAGDIEYAAWVESKGYMARVEILRRLAFYK